MTSGRKTVALSLPTHNRLAMVGGKGDTYDRIITRLMDERDQLIPWCTELVKKQMDDLYGRFSNWEETETAIQDMIAEIPCEDIRAAAREYLDKLRADQEAYEAEM